MTRALRIRLILSFNFIHPEIPSCSISNDLKENFLEETDKGTYLERIFQQFFMIPSQFGSEGGLFIFVGRKK